MEQTGIIPNAFKVITNKVTNKRPRVSPKDGHKSPAEACENKPEYIRYLEAVENEMYDYEDIPSFSDNEDIIIEDEIDVLEDNLYSGSTNYSNYTSRSIQTSNIPTTKPIVQHQSKLTQTKFTCNDSICGIIAAQDFTIHCFYCYQEFPLKKCSYFIRHIQSMHPQNVKKNCDKNDNHKNSNQLPIGDKRLHSEVESVETATSESSSKIRKVNADQVDIKNPSQHNSFSSLDSKKHQESAILIGNGWSSKYEGDDSEMVDDPDGLHHIEKNILSDNKKSECKVPDLPTLIANEWSSQDEDDNADEFQDLQNIEDASQDDMEYIEFLESPPLILDENDIQAEPMETIVATTIEPVLPFDDLVKPKVTPQNPPQVAPFPSRYIDSEDDMPSNDENEDEQPSSTNNCGILFGLTNRKIVFEFLRQLEKYPELYNFQETKNRTTLEKIRSSIMELRTHINSMFNIHMTDVEVRLSIQRIYIWFNRTMRANEKAKDLGTKFTLTFPEYYEILERFLKENIRKCNKNIIWINNTGRKDYNDIWRYPRWMLYKESQKKKKPYFVNSAAPDMDLIFGDEDTQTESDDNNSHDDPQTPPEPIICDICYEDFQRRIDLRRHRIKHFPPQHACSVCCRMHFTRQMAKDCQHQNISKKRVWKRPSHCYVCETCGATYKTVSNLNFHIREKHKKQRLRCIVCKFSCSNSRSLRQHQTKIHVVEFGTCDEIVRRSKPQHVAKMQYNPEERQEYLWFKVMRKTKTTGNFYGCFRCKLVFDTPQEKRLHNQQEHPITEKTLLCFLCHHDFALFCSVVSIRRHYVSRHNVPWEKVDRYVKSTKTLIELLTPEEYNLVQSSDNKMLVLSQILSNKSQVKREIAPMSTNLGTESVVLSDDEDDDGILYYPIVPCDDDDESNDDDLNQSTLYRDFEIDLDENAELCETGNNQYLNVNLGQPIDDEQVYEIDGDLIETQQENIENIVEQNINNNIVEDILKDCY